MNKRETPSEAYDRGYIAGLAKAGGWDWEAWWTYTFASIAGAALIAVALLGIWNFIHWASDHSNGIHCLNVNGQTVCESAQ
jgi:hypothetical protein